MYLARGKWPSANRKVYKTAYLRESYRVGRQVKTRIIANLTHCSEEELDAIELALKHKGNLAVLGSVENVEMVEGLSVGAVWTVYEVARRRGMEKALGKSFQGQLGLWQVMARVIHPGSRLSAVRLAQTQAACDVLGMRRGFDENDLYGNQRWLSGRQGKIEDGLFRLRERGRAPQLFLYDVTSTYLEGKNNAFGDYGYSRDGKKGKKQIVVGLLCDEEGEPVSTEVFRGNTADAATFASQVRKAAERFGCRRVTFVGDRGMLRSGQIEQLSREGFHYITAITKPQIKALVARGVIQMDLFEEELCEVEEGGVRYILRRNPCRAEEMAATRADKQRCVERLVEKQNDYLRHHPRARVSTAQTRVREKIERLRIGVWLEVQAKEKTLRLCVDERALQEVSRLDGCYVIKSDLPKDVASKETLHDRYKDLAEVEQAFRTCKTVHLELRPVHVRTAPSTRAHALVVMLAYMIRRELSRAWAPFDVTVEEGLDQLKTLCSTEVKVKGGGSCLRIPTPRPQSRQLLQALGITLPPALPHRDLPVVTRKKLSKNRRKP
jgi:hypothetical protein